MRSSLSHRELTVVSIHPTAEMTTVPLAANIQVRAGDLGTVGMIGVVARTSDDLKVLMKAIREETGNSQARVFIVTGDKKVVSVSPLRYPNSLSF